MTSRPGYPLMISRMSWGQKYLSIAASWRRAWQEGSPFFAFPPAVRKIIYTTDAKESLNRVIRKATKNARQLSKR